MTGRCSVSNRWQESQKSGTGQVTHTDSLLTGQGGQGMRS